MMDEFRQQLLSGSFSEERLIDLYENNLLTEQQQKVILELAPVLGGLKNVGQKIAGNIGNAFKQAKQQGLDKASQGWLQKTKDAYNQGKQETTYNNNVSKVAKQWKMIDKTITNSRLFEQMEQFRKSFQGTDEYVDKSLGYINQAFLDLQSYLAKKYPQLQVQADDTYTPSWKERQRSVDAQTGVAKSQLNKRYRQDVARNPGKSRNTLGTKVRNAMQ